MEHQVLPGYQDQKDQLEEWACQEHLEKRACLASPANRASLAPLERKEQRERRDRQVYLASAFPDGLATRETKA